ncbi:MAG: (d)CMP kinase [Deltaproteobacteria bacterium]|nr:(d)CMP kinase [Deltaproteobacteria bacterium]
MRKLIIAIDGPAGAGKSTVAKRLARELGYLYMDTGAMYRALAWKVLLKGIAVTEEALSQVLGDTQIELVEGDGYLRVLLDGSDVTHQIRTPEVSQMASKISALKIVRERMVQLQRAMGVRGGIVAEGRDIGTVVFPDADVKIYLDASTAERGRRRFEELKTQGKAVTLEETLEEMDERDRRDTERVVAPLRKADDALYLDSTLLDVDEVMRRSMREIEHRMENNQ